MKCITLSLSVFFFFRVIYIPAQFPVASTFPQTKVPVRVPFVASTLPDYEKKIKMIIDLVIIVDDK